MTKEEFREIVASGLRERLGDAYVVSVQNVPKNNGTMKTGISVLRLGKDAGPTMYVDGAFDKFIAGDLSLEDILNEAMDVVKETAADADIDVVRLAREAVQGGRLFPKVINAAKNAALLDKVPHRTVLGDLAVIYCCEIAGPCGAGSVDVNAELAERLGMSEPELHEAALANLRERKPAVVQGLGDLLVELKGPMVLPVGVPVPPMMVVSNAERTQGASCLLMPEAFARLADTIGQDLWVIPSSIHELMVVPQDYISEEEMTAMVREVNKAAVLPSEVLSDHVYRFSRGENAITAA